MVCGWSRSWHESGDTAITLKNRGCGAEEKRLPTKAQETALKKLLRDKNPKQLKLPFAPWNRKAIQSVIYQMWRVRIAIRLIGDYMKRWGFTSQKLAKRAYERNPKVVQKWQDETYPEIKPRASKEWTEIYWGMRLVCAMTVSTVEDMHPRARHPLWKITLNVF